MENLGLSNDVSNIIHNSFNSIDNYTQLLPYIQSSPFTLFYGPTASGKTFALKSIFKLATGSLIYIRSSPVRWESDNQLFSVKHLDSSMKTINMVNKLIKSRGDRIKNGEVDDIAWCSIVFDDIQNLDKSISNAFTVLMSTLAFSGRHYKIRTIVLVQSYMRLEKSIRSQASSFLCLLPINDTYRRQIYTDYWQIFDNDRALTELETLPKYSFLFKFETKTRLYHIGGREVQ